MKNFILLIICFTTSVYSSTYLAHSSNGGMHYLSQFDPNTGKQHKIKQLGKANNKTSLIYHSKKNQLIAVLLQQDTSDVIIVVNKNSLQEINRFQVPTVKWKNVENLTISPIMISPDDSKLIVISQISTKQELNIFDIKSKKVLYTRKLGSKSYHISQSFDLNFICFESLSAKSRMFIVIDINNYKTSTIVNLGQSPVKTQVFANSLFISSERSPKRNKYYSLSRVDFNTNKKTPYQNQSLTHFVFAHNNDQTQLFLSGQNVKNKKDLFLLTLLNDFTFIKTNFYKKVRPFDMLLNKNENKLMIIGKSKLATIDIETKTLLSRIRIPFDPLSGMMNAAGTIGYIQEDNGSEIGSFDLIKGKLIEQSNAGRFISQVIVNTRKYFVSGIISYLFERKNSLKSIMLNNTENQLFVINSTTNDLTIFDAHTLKKQYAKGTGFKTYFMSQGSEIESPILVIGDNRISLIDNFSNTLILKLKGAKLMGLDKENNLLFYILSNAMYVYDMLNRKELSKINDFTVLAVYTY